jgi:hypothetical protein
MRNLFFEQASNYANSTHSCFPVLKEAIPGKKYICELVGFNVRPRKHCRHARSKLKRVGKFSSKRKKSMEGKDKLM